MLVLGLDFAGKTTMVYALKPPKVEMSIPTIGFTVEQAEVKTQMNVALWPGGRVAECVGLIQLGLL